MGTRAMASSGTCRTATELLVRVHLWKPETLAWRADFLAALGAPTHEVDALRSAAEEARNARGTPHPASSPP
jgi:hypothetical protein